MASRPALSASPTLAQGIKTRSSPAAYSTALPILFFSCLPLPTQSRRASGLTDSAFPCRPPAPPKDTTRPVSKISQCDLWLFIRSITPQHSLLDRPTQLPRSPATRSHDSLRCRTTAPFLQA